MTKEERHALIMDMLIQQNSILVTDLSERLQVSSVTIRKDLTELERAKKLYRSHGRAILINPYINNRNVNVKEKLCIDEKRIIGKVAASMITHDDSILIASGTTVHALARSIEADHKLTVITASLQVSELLSGQENIDIIQLGGMLRHSSLSVVGNYAESILSNFFCSKLFLGVDGIDLDYGSTNSNIEEALLNIKMIEASQRTIIMADSSKFGRRGFGRICNLDRIDVIITDSGITASVARAIEDAGIELIIT